MRVFSGFFAVLLVGFFVPLACVSGSSGLVLKAEQRWDTYGAGSTCISGSNNLFVGNLDGDVDVEIVTGGSGYKLSPNGSALGREAPLRIWNWNGKTVTLEYTLNWPGNINSVYAADVDGDEKPELFTSGTVRNETGSYSSLRVWQCTDGEVKLRSSFEGVSTSAVFVCDVDGDGKQDILTVGRFNTTSQYGARLNLWHLDEGKLYVKSSVEWCLGNVTSAGSLFAGDLDKDGTVEIVTGGYAYMLSNSTGQVRVWQFKDNSFVLKASEEWRLVDGVHALTIAGGVQGNTVVNSVKIADVDENGVSEVVTGGFTYDGENVNAQLRIWAWNGESLSLLKSAEWVTDYLTEVKCVAIGDVNGDSKVEIVTSGLAGAKGSFANETSSPNLAQLRVWSYGNASLSLNESQDWTVDDGATAWSVGIRNIDSDAVAEIVTVGCVGMDRLCDPNMRIWSVSHSSSLPLLPIAAVGFGLAIVLVTAFILVRRRR